jgi:dihydropyrimidine dehydrogenase (NAD+) subunit PreA
MGRAAKVGGADGISAINTLNSITGIDLDTFTPRPDVNGKSTHGGYCGPAVKPIALNMVQQLAGVQLPVSGIGGVSTWRDAAEFILLGCGSVQVCTAAMHYGFRIVEDMIDGLKHWMDEKGFARIDDFRGLSLPRMTEWKHLDLNYKIVARIHPELCIGCDLCYIACWDGAHQCIHRHGHALPEQVVAASLSRLASTPSATLDAGGSRNGASKTPPERIPYVDEAECVGCNLCWLVCPVEHCITMDRVDTGQTAQTWAERTAGGCC